MGAGAQEFVGDCRAARSPHFVATFTKFHCTRCLRLSGRATVLRWPNARAAKRRARKGRGRARRVKKRAPHAPIGRRRIRAERDIRCRRPPNALLELGLRYRADGTSFVDLIRAQQWSNLAAIRGNDEAKRYRWKSHARCRNARLRRPSVGRGSGSTGTDSCRPLARGAALAAKIFSSERRATTYTPRSFWWHCRSRGLQTGPDPLSLRWLFAGFRWPFRHIEHGLWLALGRRFGTCRGRLAGCS